MKTTFIEFVLCFLAVMALSALGGCGDFPPNGAGPPVTFLYVAPGADITEAEALAGCEMWTPVGAECAMVNRPEAAITITTFNDITSGLWGQWDGGRGIRVNVAEPEWVRSTIAHELGHSFGLPESPDWRDLMGVGQYLTANDIAAYQAVPR